MINFIESFITLLITHLSLALLLDRLSASFCSFVFLVGFDWLSLPLHDDLRDFCFIEAVLLFLVILGLVWEPVTVVTPSLLDCAPLLHLLLDVALVIEEIKGTKHDMNVVSW